MSKANKSKYPPNESIAQAILDALAELGGKAEPREVYPIIATKYRLSFKEREAKLKSGDNKWKKDIRGARQNLVRKGYILESSDGIWRLSDEVRKAAKDLSQNKSDLPSTSQGFLVSPEDRKVIEERAVCLAIEHFKKHYFDVEVKGKPFDLLCTKGTETVYVEVKGTQTDGKEILLTPGEVKFNDDHHNEMALFVVSGIDVKGKTGNRIASGGKHVVIHPPWKIDHTRLKLIGYRYVY